MALFPLTSNFEGDFVLQLVAVDTDNTMDEVAAAAAVHSVGRRVRARPGHILRVRRIARLDEAIVTAGCAPGEALGFDQRHAFAAQHQFARDAEARYAATDNADIDIKVERQFWLALKVRNREGRSTAPVSQGWKRLWTFHANLVMRTSENVIGLP